FGLVVHDGYGLTEASPVVTTTAVTRESRPGSIGPPLPGVEVRLVGEDGNTVLDGDPGEIVVRGPNVFAGYWQDDDATARVLRAGARVDPVELLRFGGRRLARYKLPTRVELTDALPRTFAGKVLRRALSDRVTRSPDATTNPA